MVTGNSVITVLCGISVPKTSAALQQASNLKYLQISSVSWRRVMGLLQLVQAWVMLGPSWLPCPAAVAAMDATMMEEATSPGTSV